MGNTKLSELQYEDKVARAVKHGAEDEMSRAIALKNTSIVNLRKARDKEQVANETAKHALQALEEAHQSVDQALAATAVAEKRQADFEMARVREEEKALRAANTSLIEQEEHISKDDGDSGIAGSAAEISALQSKVHRLEKDDKKDDKKDEKAERKKKKGEKEDEKKDENKDDNKDDKKGKKKEEDDKKDDQKGHKKDEEKEEKRDAKDGKKDEKKKEEKKDAKEDKKDEKEKDHKKEDDKDEKADKKE